MSLNSHDTFFCCSPPNPSAITHSPYAQALMMVIFILLTALSSSTFDAWTSIRLLMRLLLKMTQYNKADCLAAALKATAFKFHSDSIFLLGSP